MKKITSIVLLLVLCLSLCACEARRDKVMNELVQGQWSGKLSFDSYHMCRQSYIYFKFFEDGTVEVREKRDEQWFKWFETTYEIQNREIILTTRNYSLLESDPDYKSRYIKYKYRNGELKLTYIEGNVQEDPLKHEL